MRRTSTRKSASIRAKLLNSIRPAERQIQFRMMEMLEQRTLMSLSNLPTPVPTGPETISRGGVSAAAPNYDAETTDNNNTPSIAVDPNNPNKLVTVWTDHHLTGNVPYEVMASFSKRWRGDVDEFQSRAAGLRARSRPRKLSDQADLLQPI